MTSALQEVQRVLDQMTESGRILDVGCGRKSPFNYGCHVTGVDSSPEALAANPQIDDGIEAEIESVDLPAHAFDAVICWNTLEHLRDPFQVVESMAAAVAPSGFFILGFPNVLSVRGLVTKTTPHWFHVWAYRRILQNRDAGKPGYPPFPTFLPFSLRRVIVERRLWGLGFEIEIAIDYREPSFQRAIEQRMPRIAAALWRVGSWVIATISGRIIHPMNTDVLIIARRTGGDA